jgi:hypothetical protein
MDTIYKLYENKRIFDIDPWDEPDFEIRGIEIPCPFEGQTVLYNGSYFKVMAIRKILDLSKGIRIIQLCVTAGR